MPNTARFEAEVGAIGAESDFAIPSGVLDPALQFGLNDLEDFAPPPKREAKRRPRKVVFIPTRRTIRSLQRGSYVAADALMVMLRASLFSLTVHAILLFIFLFITIERSVEEVVPPVQASLETPDRNFVVSDLMNDADQPEEIPEEHSEEPKLPEQLELEESASLDDTLAPNLSQDNEPFKEFEMTPDPVGFANHNPAVLHGTSSGMSGSGVLGATGDFENRRGEKRLEAAKLYGGGQEAIDAVEAALEWLKRHQLPDGSWDASGRNYTESMPTLNGRSSNSGYNIGVTSLSLLAFLGAGYTVRDGEYGKVIKAGLQYLINSQDARGRFNDDSTDSHSYDAYNTAVATLALAEACVMHGNLAHLRKPLKRSLDFWQRCQGKEGGWSYFSGYGEYSSPDRSGRVDLSITGWVILAFDTVREAGLEVPESLMRKAEDLYDKYYIDKTGGTYYANKSPHSWREGMGMAGVGLTARRILDPNRFRKHDQKSVRLLLQNVPSWSTLTMSRGVDGRTNLTTLYGWYYSTLGMFYATGGDGVSWERWNGSLKTALLPTQVKVGEDKGSWPPSQPWIGNWMGRVYSTAQAALTLEVYYRHKPTTERLLKASE